jgi:uncharacterized membrane protein YqjE
VTQGTGGGGQGGGLFDSVRQLARTAVGLVETRLEIVVTELEEERLRLRQTLVLAVIAGFCLGVAALLAVMFIVVVFWDSHRLAAIGLLFVLFLGGGGFAATALVRHGRTRQRLFDATLGELRKDRERLARRS